MDVNAQNLSILNTAVNTAFNKAFSGAESMYKNICTIVPSKTSANTYTWLGNSSQIQEWIGPRVINRLKNHDFTIRNRKFEKTEAIPKDAIDDDEYGTYMPLFEQMAVNAKEFPDLLAFPLLKNGFTELCYDGQPYFDNDHPVGNDGEEVSVSNMQAGAGDPWFLMCTKRPLKPLIWQERRQFNISFKTDPKTSDHVFMNDEFIWGVDGRCNVGFGLWQLAFGSKGELNADNYEAADAAMMSFTNDAGSPLGIVPNLMVVGPKNKAKAKNLLKVMNTANGASNPNYESVELLVVPWLA